jgi:hypothetical protein
MSEDLPRLTRYGRGNVSVGFIYRDAKAYSWGLNSMRSQCQEHDEPGDEITPNHAFPAWFRRPCIRYRSFSGRHQTGSGLLPPPRVLSGGDISEALLPSGTPLSPTELHQVWPLPQHPKDNALQQGLEPHLLLMKFLDVVFFISSH